MAAPATVPLRTQTCRNETGLAILPFLNRSLLPSFKERNLLIQREEGDVDPHYYELRGEACPYRVVDPRGYLGGAIEMAGRRFTTLATTFEPFPSKALLTMLRWERITPLACPVVPEV